MQPLVRRKFAGALFALIAGFPSVAGAAAPSRPDILLIMPDQFRGDCLSVLAHPVVRTPNLDALARAGALFRRAYATVPSCIPARFALMTGLAPQTSGVVGYAEKKITTPTLPELLVKAGYATALVGRNMHQGEQNGSLGYQAQILGSTYIAGDAYDLDLQRAVPSAGGIRPIVERLRLDNNRWPAEPWPLAEELHPTSWIVRRSRDTIAQTPAARPLFLTASFYAPHPPLFPPARIFDANLKKTLPPVAMGAWVNRAALSTEGNPSGHRILLEGEKLRRAQAGYFGLIDHLDEQLGSLIADFKARSERAGRPWLIVVTSDHGESLGDHGFFRKCEPYEGSANIPFLIAGSPGLGFRPGLRSDRPVCLEDIMPTLLSLAGTERPANLDGIDLAPALRGTTTAVRDWLHSEHSPIYGPEQAFHALTDGRMKYLWRPHDGSEQLFNLDADPQEERDLSADPAHRAELAAWRGRLVRRLAGRPEGFSDGTKLIAGRPYPAIQVRP
jgi:arylsulfatase